MHGANLQFNVQTDLLIHFHKKGGHGHCPKTVVLRGDRVRPGKKIVDAITAESIRGSGSRETGIDVASDDDNRLYRGGLLIADVTQQAAGGNLGERRSFERKEYKQ